MHPTYSGCKEGIYSGKVDVKCPAGQSIKITISTCSMEVGAQTGLSAMSFDNNAAGTETVGANVEKIAYTVTKDGFLCPLNGGGNFSDGRYTGTTLVQGKDSGGSADAIAVIP